MTQVEGTKMKILKRRMEIIWDLHCEGWSDIDIGEMFNGVDRTWIFRLRKKMPRGWKAAWSKANKSTF